MQNVSRIVPVYAKIRPQVFQVIFIMEESNTEETNLEPEASAEVVCSILS
jgi:hypothetical protein